MLVPSAERNPKGGRPRAEDRDCFEGVLWVLRNGARWRDLPDDLPSSTTCWRRLLEWEDAGVFIHLWHAFIDELDQQGRTDWDELFVRGRFTPAGEHQEPPSEEQLSSGWWSQMAKEYLERTRPSD